MHKSTPVRIGKKNGQVCIGVEYTNLEACSKKRSIGDNAVVVPVFGITIFLKGTRNSQIIATAKIKVDFLSENIGLVF